MLPDNCAPVLVIAFLALLLTACQSPESDRLSAEEIARNNEGVALMGQYRNEDARQVFAELLAGRPDWTDVEVNLAIATLNRQEPGDELVALEIVERVLLDHPGHLRARYIAGLMRLYIGDTEAALAHLEQVAAAVPDDAYVAYFTGQALSQLGRIEDALGRYLQAIGSDPYLRSAYYGAALAYRQLGQAEQAREMLAVYQRFESNPRAQLAEFVYTRKGVLAEALAVDLPGQAAAAAARSDGPLFEQSIQLAGLPSEFDPGSATVADINGDGRLDLFLAGSQSQVWLQAGSGRFEFQPDHPLSELGPVQAAFWGDLFNRGQLDGLFCRSQGTVVMQRSIAGDWSALEGVGELANSAACRDGALLDADHDGDLDLMMLNAAGPNELFNNDFNGDWRRLSESTDGGLLGGGDRTSRQLLVADLDQDRDADLVVIHDRPPHQVLINDRLWRYRVDPAFAEFVAADLVAVAALDPQARGRIDLISLDRAGALLRWQADEQGRWQPETLAQLEIGDPASAALSAIDFSGNGVAELLVQHSNGFELHGWSDDGRLSRLYSEAQPLAALTPILLEPEHGPALVGVVETGEGKELMLWPAGSGRGHFVVLAPSGLSDTGAGMRSNASGIGTKLMLRTGSQWAIADTHDRHGAPGQSLQPLAIGVGQSTRADFVKLLWSDGVMQTEMNLAAGQLHRIAEHQRQLASCPVLFAWNGEEVAFVSDLLGVAGLGFLLEPGRYAEPRPWEFFRFPTGSIAPREGRYEIKIGEPMEEIAYIDSVRLHLFDLPRGWAVALDERMHTGGGPAPTGQPMFYREAGRLRPLAALNDRDQDVLASVLAVDAVAAPPGPRDRRYLGRLEQDHVLDLDFGQVINPPETRPVLVASGWVDYPYSQTLFAAWQAGESYRPPSLDAWADGRWQSVYEQFGYPAGMPREMSLPLDDLPPGTTALRLRGNWEVYWDEISVVHSEPAPVGLQRHVLERPLARLARTGFPRRSNLDQARPHFDYADRAPFWDTRYPTGFYTDFGRVDQLVGEANGALVVFGPGEELHMEFEAPSAPIDGVRREVVLEVRGFAKDMDLYTRDGGQVGPLPLDEAFHDPEARERLHRATLNRFQGGY